MKVSNKTIIEFLGFLAVAASLAFVGMQLLLDRRVAVADQYFNRSESVKEDRRTLLVSPAFYQLEEERWALGERPDYWNEDWKIAQQLEQGSVSVSSLWVQILELQLSIIGYDNIYFQYKQGLIDEAVWEGFRTQFKPWLIAYPELDRAVILNHARPTIRPLIEQIVDEIENGQ